MALVITRSRPRPPRETASQRAAASTAGRLNEGFKRKAFLVSAEVDQKATALMKEYKVSFADLVRSLILSA